MTLSFSADHGAGWSDYQVAARGDPARGLDCRDPALGQAADGALVLAHGVAGYDAAGHDSKDQAQRDMEVIRDGGRSFDTTREYVLSDSGFHYDCGYPSTVGLADGTIVTVAHSIMDIRHQEWRTCCLAYRYRQELFE